MALRTVVDMLELLLGGGEGVAVEVGDGASEQTEDDHYCALQKVMACIAVAYIVMPYVGVAYIVMPYIGMAYIVLAKRE